MANPVLETYVLYQCGTAKPNLGSGSNTKYFSVPIQHSAMDNSLVVFFRVILFIKSDFE
jgi:hypothetical protein